MGSRSRKLPDATVSQLRPLSNVPIQTELVRTHTRGFVIAWVFALIFYFFEYAVRSSPSVMLPQLATSFGTTALGVSSILVRDIHNDTALLSYFVITGVAMLVMLVQIARGFGREA